ncbi:hypothetical protein LINGRAHAP2_LOCUS16645 [Linum grandiflorum]
MASRYNSYDSTRSSASSFVSDPASSAEFHTNSSSRALVKSKPSSDLSKQTSAKSKPTTTHNLSAMVKKFMEKKSTSTTTKGSSRRNQPGFVIPADLIAEDLKKTARKGAPGLGGLQKKLFGKDKEKRKKEVKALTEVKGCNNSNGGNVANTRTLAMVLRSERELLCANKDMEAEVSELRLMLETKNGEVSRSLNNSVHFALCRSEFWCSY